MHFNDKNDNDNVVLWNTVLSRSSS